MSAMKLHETSGRSKVGSLRSLSLKMFLHVLLVSSHVFSNKTIWVVLAIQTPPSCSFAHLLITIPTNQMLLFEVSNLLPNEKPQFTLKLLETSQKGRISFKVANSEMFGTSNGLETTPNLNFSISISYIVSDIKYTPNYNS